jgi:hypothetical protein
MAMRPLRPLLHLNVKSSSSYCVVRKPEMVRAAAGVLRERNPKAGDPRKMTTRGRFNIWFKQRVNVKTSRGMRWIQSTE